jgi:HEAT repeat protein
MRELGMMIFCYLRDTIFKGGIFCAEDPYKHIKWENLKRTITNEKIISALIPALQDKRPEIKYEALKLIGLLQIKSERFVLPLIDSLKIGNDWGIRQTAVVDIRLLGMKDERFISPLLDILSETKFASHGAPENGTEKWYLQQAVKETIKTLEIDAKERKFIIRR